MARKTKPVKRAENSIEARAAQFAAHEALHEQVRNARDPHVITGIAVEAREGCTLAHAVQTAQGIRQAYSDILNGGHVWLIFRDTPIRIDDTSTLESVQRDLKKRSP